MSDLPLRIFLPLVLSSVVVATAGCAKSDGTAGAPATTAHASMAPPGMPATVSSSPGMTLRVRLSEPIAKVEALAGDPAVVCVYDDRFFFRYRLGAAERRGGHGRCLAQRQDERRGLPGERYR